MFIHSTTCPINFYTYLRELINITIVIIINSISQSNVTVHHSKSHSYSSRVAVALCCTTRYSLFAIHTFSRVFSISAASYGMKLLVRYLGARYKFLEKCPKNISVSDHFFTNNNSLLVVPVSLIWGVS